MRMGVDIAKTKDQIRLQAKSQERQQAQPPKEKAKEWLINTSNI